MNTRLYAVTSDPNDVGDCFYGTFEQFNDCFGENVQCFEDLKEVAPKVFLSKVAVTVVKDEDTEKDVAFCKEFVARLVTLTGGKLQTKTTIELERIVGGKKSIPVDTMWDDESLEKLGYNTQQSSVLGFVYKFVRDNQELFLED